MCRRTGSPLAALRGHVPFLVELRDFVARETDGRCRDLIAYLGFCGQELNFGFDAAAVEQHFAARPSLLIIDGLDEIFAPGRRALMMEQIVGLSTRFPALRILLTSRIAGFHEAPLRSAGFAVATLTDLTDEQVKRFAGAWFPLVFPGDAAAAERAREDLLETLARRPQLSAIAGNPMILTIMATVARHQRLGRSRAALYAQALELLCYAWDYRRGLNLPADSPLADLQPDDTRLMLRRIAWHMQQSEGGLRANAIIERDLRAVLENFFAEDWRFAPPKARHAAAEMLTRLQERNWVLTLRGPGLFGFVHRTFLEYLCATEIAEQFRAQQIDIARLIERHVVPHQDDDSWQEVIRLLAGALPPPAAEQIVLACVPSDAELVKNVSRLGIAWQCLAEIEPRAIPSLAQACSRLTDSFYVIFEQPGPRGKDVLEKIFDSATTMGRIRWPVPHPPAREWPIIPKDATRISHLGYAISFWCLRKMTLTVWSDADPETGSRLRADASGHQESDYRSIMLDMLAVSFRDDPRTAALLRGRAVDDPDPSCRSTALWAIGTHFPDDPETLGLLSARAIDDADDGVRRTAFLAAGQLIDGPHAATLLFDGSRFIGRDPRDPITSADIAKVAAELSLTQEAVRALYARIAEFIPLRFEDPPKEPPPTRRRARRNSGKSPPS